MASTYKTRGRVCSVTNICTLLHTLTMCIATSELWQWTRHRIDTVLCTDPGYMPPQWLVLPDITLRPKIKRPGKIWLRTYTMQCGMEVLSLYMTTWTSSGVLEIKLKRYGKRTTSLVLTWRNVHGEILILLGTPFLLTHL